MTSFRYDDGAAEQWNLKGSSSQPRERQHAGGVERMR